MVLVKVLGRVLMGRLGQLIQVEVEVEVLYQMISVEQVVQE